VATPDKEPSNQMKQTEIRRFESGPRTCILHSPSWRGVKTAFPAETSSVFLKRSYAQDWYSMSFLPEPYPCQKREKSGLTGVAIMLALLACQWGLVRTPTFSLGKILQGSLWGQKLLLITIVLRACALLHFNESLTIFPSFVRPQRQPFFCPHTTPKRLEPPFFCNVLLFLYFLPSTSLGRGNCASWPGPLILALLC